MKHCAVLYTRIPGQSLEGQMAGTVRNKPDTQIGAFALSIPSQHDLTFAVLNFRVIHSRHKRHSSPSPTWDREQSPRAKDSTKIPHAPFKK
jgi:hypothetical protein